MSGTAKILILGNGFDLAHFLPTKYDHFMHAMRNVENYDKDTPMTFQELYTDLISNESYFFENTIRLYKTEDATLPLEEIKELQDRLNKNGWFQYFKSYIDSGIETWIDFENEMETVLDAVCYIISEIEKNIEHLQRLPSVDSLILGGVLKSMLASDIAIIDIEEYQIKHLKVVIKLL